MAGEAPTAQQPAILEKLFSAAIFSRFALMTGEAPAVPVLTRSVFRGESERDYLLFHSAQKENCEQGHYEVEHQKAQHESGYGSFGK